MNNGQGRVPQERNSEPKRKKRTQSALCQTKPLPSKGGKSRVNSSRPKDRKREISLHFQKGKQKVAKKVEETAGMFSTVQQPATTETGNKHHFTTVGDLKECAQ